MKTISSIPTISECLNGKNILHISSSHVQKLHLNKLKLMDYIFESRYFSFNGMLYQQFDRSAMGNPASPVLANLVLNEFITDYLGNYL